MSGIQSHTMFGHCVSLVLLNAAIFAWGPATVVGQQEQEQAEKQKKQVKAPPAAEAKSSAEALAAYADAANYQNKLAYELAAEEWTRFLERFEDDPLAAKARHYRGVCLVQLKKYAEAATALEAVISKYPDFELLEETYLNLGWSQYCLGQAGDEKAYAQAAKTFDKLETALPKGKYADQALFFRGESLYALGKKKEAAMAYGKLATGHEKSDLRADALYALGVTLEEIGDWEKAKKSYEMFLKDYAENDLATEVRLRLAESILQSGDPQAAGDLFGEVAAISGFDAADHALMRQAYCQARQGKDVEAATLYEKLVELFPESDNVAEAKMSAARCYYRANKHEQAGKRFDEVLSAGTGDMVEAAHWRCRIHLAQGQAQEALTLADETLAAAGNNPFVPKLRLDKADALYELPKRKSDALQEYLAIAEAYPKQEVVPIALYNAAFAALELEDYKQATELAGQFLASHPEHPLNSDTRYIVAECRIQAQAYEEAETIYRQLVKSAKDHPEIPVWRVRLALVLFLRDKHQEVIELLAPAAKELEHPAHKAEAFYLLGASRFALKEYKAAIESLQASISADDSWRQADQTLLYLARAQRQQKHVPEAIASLEDLLKRFPKSELLDETYYRLGENYYAAERYSEAVDAYDSLLEKFKDSSYGPLALYGKGWAHMKSGDFEPAAAAFATLIEQHADHELSGDALLARGMCYRQAKKYKESIADLNKYVSDDVKSPRTADALYELGLAEALSEQFDKAVKTFNRLLEQQPDYPNADKVRYELAWAYKSLANEKAAARAFATLAEKHADSPLAMEAHFHVGERAYADGDYATAVKAYQQAAKSGDAALHEKAVYKLGWSHYQLKEYEGALGRFEALLKSHGDGQLASDAWFMKGECLFKQEKFEQALPAYQEAIGRDASSDQIAVLRQLHAAQAAGQLGKWEESVALLDPLIANHADSYYLAEAHFERGQAKLKLEQPDEAIKDFRRAAEESRGLVGIRALFMAGEAEFQQKRYEDAIKDFQRAMFRSLPEDASDGIRNWQAKSGYEAARCSEVQISDAESSATRGKYIADAKKFYQYVIQNHAEHELAAEAKKRLSALSELTP